MRRTRPGLVLAVVGFGMFVAADDLTVVSTLLRQIVGDLDIALPERIDDAAWIVNAYLVAYVAVMPIAGRLSDIVGRRAVVVAGLALFAVGSAFIPFTTSLGPFLFWRIVTALGGGAVVPVALAAVADVYPEGGRGRALGTLGALETLGWVWGPLFGAMLVRFLDWRWQFYLNVPLAIAGIAAAWVVMRGVGEPDPTRRLDALGAITLSSALIALTIGLVESGDIASATDLAGLTETGGLPAWPFFALAVLAGGAFVVTERGGRDPLVGRDVLSSRTTQVALGTNALVGAVLAIAMVDIPLFVNLVVETEVRPAAVTSGWVLTGLTASMAVMTVAGGRLGDRISHRMPTLVGLGVSGVALILMGSTWDTTIDALAMGLHSALLGAGIGLVTAPLTTTVVDEVPSDRRGLGTSFVVISRLIGLAVGLAGLTAWALHRYDDLRASIDLPPLTDPEYAAAADSAQRTLSASVLSETFLAAAVVAALAFVLATWLRPRHVEGRAPK
ncbi:MAG TPA: MFS transporter [Acidimicrobiia bacterium]|nr:MFS transporter [Acidimicrobiia bacterium]